MIMDLLHISVLILVVFLIAQHWTVLYRQTRFEDQLKDLWVFARKYAGEKDGEEMRRAVGEATRTGQEYSRVHAESGRVNAEDGRVVAEETRVENEHERKVL